MSKFDLEVTLREITKENWRDIVRLKVAPHQEQFVTSNATSIAEAHFNPEIARNQAIYALDGAIPEDKPVLQAYAAAYLAERGSGSLNRPWDDWIQKRSIAVLEHENQIVSVVRYITTRRDALIIAPFTFPEFRRQGFARKLLAFLVGELLQVYPRVRLWVDEDNIGAIALYKSLDFHIIGKCYSGYWK